MPDHRARTPVGEDRLVARVVWEHSRGRPLAEILADPTIRVRCSDRECRSLLSRPELYRAIAGHFHDTSGSRVSPT